MQYNIRDTSVHPNRTHPHHESIGVTPIPSGQVFSGWVHWWIWRTHWKGWIHGWACHCMKFRWGLNPSIQTCIALTLEGHLKEDQPLDWYMAVRVLALTHAANEAFQASRTTSATTTASSFAGIHRGAEGSNRVLPPPVVCPNIMPVIPAPPMAPGPTPMDVDAMKWRFGIPRTCQCCGKVGHFVWECPQAYNVCYMMADECEEFTEHLLMAEDILKAAKGSQQVETEQERPEDFVSSSEWRMCPHYPCWIDLLFCP